MADASQKLIDAARQEVAELLEAAVDVVVLDQEGGRFHVAGAPSRSVDWAALAARARQPLTGLSDFVGNLERSGYFQKSVEIVSSATDTGTAMPGEVIKFEIKAIFKGPGDVDAAKVADAKGAAGQLKKKS